MGVADSEWFTPVERRGKNAELVDEIVTRACSTRGVDQVGAREQIKRRVESGSNEEGLGKRGTLGAGENELECG